MGHFFSIGINPICKDFSLPNLDMYPSSPSQNNGVPATSTGLARYRSAPGSFLSATVDSVINQSGGGDQRAPTRFFSPPDTGERPQTTTSFCLNEFATAFNGLKGTNEDSCSNAATSTSTSTLLRQSSSPAGFLNGLVSSFPNDGRVSRTSSQLSFTGTNSLSHISEENSMVSNSLMFSYKRSKMDVNDSELHFGFSESALEAAAMEKLMDIPHDSVPCKIRAKRGCATHPRSIAERERRTRISGKLKKLQDLVPNMDKQTSYADMLDLAVQHIKGLQSHVQNLHKELRNCTCGCKPPV